MNIRLHKIDHMLKLDDGFRRMEVGCIFTLLSTLFMFETFHNKNTWKEDKVSENCSRLVSSEKEIPLFMLHKKSIINIFIIGVQNWSGFNMPIKCFNPVCKSYS